MRNRAFSCYTRPMFKQVYVSGSLAFDRIMDFPGKFSDHILPDKLHILNVCFAINGLRENFGGTAGNIAYGLALLGERPLIVATAGRDFGPYRDWLAEHGLPTAQITLVENELTAGAYITTDRSDNQITAFNPGAMRHRAWFDLGALAPQETLAIVAPGNLEDMYRFARFYQERGIRYLFDPGQSLPAWSGGQLREMIEGSFLFISNDYELELTQEKTGLGTARILALTGAMITTRGELGALLRRTVGGTEETIPVPAIKPAAVLDPTGAGDAFRAGLIKGLLLPGGDLLHAARLGALCGTCCVEVYGTQNYRFTQAEFESRFRDHYGTRAFTA